MDPPPAKDPSLYRNAAAKTVPSGHYGKSYLIRNSTRFLISVMPPAGNKTIFLRRAGVRISACDVDEGPTWRRALAVLIITPAHRFTVLPQCTRMSATNTDFVETEWLWHVGDDHRLFISPALDGRVCENATCSVPSRTDGCESASYWVCLPERITPKTFYSSTRCAWPVLTVTVVIFDSTTCVASASTDHGHCDSVPTLLLPPWRC